jgi:hypothetical protein
MLHQLRDPLPEVLDEAPVAWQTELYVQLVDLLQARKVDGKRIVVVGPGLDVRRDVAEDVVPGEEDLLVRLVDRDMTVRVAGRRHDLQPVITDLEDLSAVERDVVHDGRRTELVPGVVL